MKAKIRTHEGIDQIYNISPSNKERLKEKHGENIVFFPEDIDKVVGQS